jgi:hypothetical protein
MAAAQESYGIRMKRCVRSKAFFGLINAHIPATVRDQGTEPAISLACGQGWRTFSFPMRIE